MRGVLGIARAGVLVGVSLAGIPVPALAQAAAQPQATAGAQPAAAAQKFTLNGDVALWTVAIKPDKTADFEKIMARLRDALLKSSDPERKRQAEGWKLMRLEKPMADGNIAYVHVITPVVAGADYTVMQALYDAFPEERQALYEMYRGAFAQNLSLATGSIVLDMNKPSQSTASAAP